MNYVFIFLTGSNNQLEYYNIFDRFGSQILFVLCRFKIANLEFRIGCWIRWARHYTSHDGIKKKSINVFLHGVQNPKSGKKNT